MVPWYSLIKQKVGLVIVSVIPSAAAIPFVIVVLPAASVPCMAIMSPFVKSFPIFCPRAIVSSAEEVVNVSKVICLPFLDLLYILKLIFGLE